MCEEDVQEVENDLNANRDAISKLEAEIVHSRLSKKCEGDHKAMHAKSKRVVANQSQRRQVVREEKRLLAREVEELNKRVEEQATITAAATKLALARNMLDAGIPLEQVVLLAELTAEQRVELEWDADEKGE